MDFFGLCGYQALVAADYLEGLPGNLPGGARFEYALTIALRHDGLLLGTLPAGASLTPSFAPLALAPGNSLAILFWDTLANAGAGRWAPLVTTNATLAGPVLLQPDLTNDTRQVLEGAHVLPTGRTETGLNFTGTIVLVSGPPLPDRHGSGSDNDVTASPRKGWRFSCLGGSPLAPIPPRPDHRS